MKRFLRCLIFGFGVGTITAIITGLHWYDWKFYALIVPIVILTEWVYD